MQPNNLVGNNEYPLQNCDSNNAINNSAQNLVTSTQQIELEEEEDPSVKKRKKIVTVVCYLILFVASIIVPVIYIVRLQQLSPPLDLNETGNFWIFYILLASCLITSGVTAFILFLVGFTKIELNRKILGAADFVLFLSWLIVALVPLSGVGDAENVKKRRQRVPMTAFGKFVATVCGIDNEHQSWSASYNTAMGIKSNETATTAIDLKKCEAVDGYMMAINGMLFWILGAYVVGLIGSVFGIGSWLARLQKCKGR